jgi:hypothetical protein
MKIFLKVIIFVVINSVCHASSENKANTVVGIDTTSSSQALKLIDPVAEIVYLMDGTTVNVSQQHHQAVIEDTYDEFPEIPDDEFPEIMNLRVDLINIMKWFENGLHNCQDANGSSNDTYPFNMKPYNGGG